MKGQQRRSSRSIPKMRLPSLNSVRSQNNQIATEGKEFILDSQINVRPVPLTYRSSSIYSVEQFLPQTERRSSSIHDGQSQQRNKFEQSQQTLRAEMLELMMKLKQAKPSFGTDIRISKELEPIKQKIITEQKKEKSQRSNEKTVSGKKIPTQNFIQKSTFLIQHQKQQSDSSSNNSLEDDKTDEILNKNKISKLSKNQQVRDYRISSLTLSQYSKPDTTSPQSNKLSESPEPSQTLKNQKNISFRTGPQRQKSLFAFQYGLQ